MKNIQACHPDATEKTITKLCLVVLRPMRHHSCFKSDWTEILKNQDWLSIIAVQLPSL